MPSIAVGLLFLLLVLYPAFRLLAYLRRPVCWKHQKRYRRYSDPYSDLCCPICRRERYIRNLERQQNIWPR